MVKKYLKDFEIGESEELPEGRTIRESDKYFSSSISGNHGELFWNEEKMKDSEFGRTLTQGPLLLIIMNDLGDRGPWSPSIIALYGYDDVRFINPVFEGDTLYMQREVVDVEEKGDDRGVLSIKEDIYKQDDSLAATRIRMYMVRKREE